MKKFKFLMVITLITLFALVDMSNAQVGIFGGVPLFQDPNPVRYIRLQDTGSSETPDSVNITIPVNGIKNYVHYYRENGNFIPAGKYTLTYLAADRSTPVSIPGIGSVEGPFNYRPNTGFTNGLQIRPPNPGAFGALGIQGTVNAVQTINGNEVIAPLFNAVAILLPLGVPSVMASARANGNGFFSLYYTDGNNKDFVPPGIYSLIVVGQTPDCNGQYSYVSPLFFYNPNTNNPDDPSYFVDGASLTVQIPVLNCQ